MPRRTPLGRRLHSGEEAVSEVVGYILMLFLSSGVLMVSLQAFMTSRETVQDLQGGQELSIIVHRLAGEVAQAGFVASEMPNATFEATLRLPPLGGRAYVISLLPDKAYANTTDGELTSEADVEVGSFSRITVGGTVQGGQGIAKVRYERHPASGDRWINLTI
jgi:hypothetical protein